MSYISVEAGIASTYIHIRHPISPSTVFQIKLLGLQRKRGVRGGRNKQRSIQVISSRDLRGKHQQQHKIIRTVDAADASRSHTARHNLVNIPLIPRNNRVQTSCKLGIWNACSLGNKSASINELIISEKLDIMCIVESSHESSLSPSLIASTPPGYTFAERARPLPPNVDLAHIRGPRGGGICIFHKNNFQSAIKDLGNFTSFELLSCYFTFRNSHLLIAVIYRPGSEPVTCTFFSELTELLSSVANRGVISTFSWGGPKFFYIFQCHQTIEKLEKTALYM